MANTTIFRLKNAYPWAKSCWGYFYHCILCKHIAFSRPCEEVWRCRTSIWIRVHSRDSWSFSSCRRLGRLASCVSCVSSSDWSSLTVCVWRCRFSFWIRTHYCDSTPWKMLNIIGSLRRLGRIVFLYDMFDPNAKSLCVSAYTCFCYLNVGDPCHIASHRPSDRHRLFVLIYVFLP